MLWQLTHFAEDGASRPTYRLRFCSILELRESSARAIILGYQFCAKYCAACLLDVLATSSFDDKVGVSLLFSVIYRGTKWCARSRSKSTLFPPGGALILVPSRRAGRKISWP